jgi:hypothetical protein
MKKFVKLYEDWFFSNPDHFPEEHEGYARGNYDQSTPDYKGGQYWDTAANADKFPVLKSDILITPEYHVYVPEHFEAYASYLTEKGVQWDTARNNEEGKRFFDFYTSKGVLIVIEMKSSDMPEDMYQLQIPLGLFFNGNNRKVNCSEFFNEYPEIYDAIYDYLSPEHKESFSSFCGM